MLLYNISVKNVLLSGDVELNPGPQISNNYCIQNSISVLDEHNFLLKYRLLQCQLRPLDVDGGGDCFFRSK